MKRVVFLDFTCPRPYDAHTLATEPMGGTEATVVRVAEALAATGRYSVFVLQHNSPQINHDPENTYPSLVTYGSLELADSMTYADAVVSLRTTMLVPFARKRFKDAKHLLWLHDFSQHELVRDYPLLENSGVKILGVSRTHKQIIADALLSQLGEIKGLTVDFVYNPVDDDLREKSPQHMLMNLVYFSSPHKGLALTLEQFGKLRYKIPELTLSVLNPGYYDSATELPPGVTSFGKLTHAETMAHVRGAFAVLHCNTVFPETFGLVYAEALAIGTPVIAHPIGAVPEVVGDRQYQVDTKDIDAIYNRLDLWWRQGRPHTEVNPQFRMSNVLKKWQELIG